jgi:hypothetical protein
MNPSDLSGEALREAFFTTCWGAYREKQNRYGTLDDVWLIPIEGRLTHLVLPRVERDANACEQWAMRWARERGLYWRIDQHQKECRVELWQLCGTWHAYGADYKEAFVRACVPAAEQLKTNGEPKHEH